MKTTFRLASKRLLAVIAALGAANALADYLAQGSTVTAVTNTGGNSSNFAVKVSGGSGACIGPWITFPEDDAPDPRAHQRAYALILLAFANSTPVKIYNYVDTTCSRASFVEIDK